MLQINFHEQNLIFGERKNIKDCSLQSDYE